jgi:hypothetical protein
LIDLIDLRMSFRWGQTGLLHLFSLLCARYVRALPKPSRPVIDS